MVYGCVMYEQQGSIMALTTLSDGMPDLLPCTDFHLALELKHHMCRIKDPMACGQIHCKTRLHVNIHNTSGNIRSVVDWGKQDR